MIEYKSNLLSQIIKNFVKTISYQIPNFEKEEIRGFIRGIIAGEGCIEINKKYKKYAVHLTANKEYERELYKDCLQRLGIECKLYENYKEMIISKRVNNVELLNQGLMTLHPKKYAKFLYIISLYNGEIEWWRKNLKKPHNKTPKKVEDKIVQLHKQNPELPTWKIGELTGVSAIKVQRILKTNNLGKRRGERTSQEMINKVLELHNKSPSLHAYQIANMLGIHKERVERIRRKYKLKKFPFKTPKEKIDRRKDRQDNTDL
ncbi:MAG: LAGLIDADG family homing endonuclease [Nanoarchaeota archaeon]|nr:LAGLIDADG family homing endonuclease [Nanoarchaeota archaeon]